MCLLYVPNSQGAIDFLIVGSGPEALVSVRDRWATRSVSVGNRELRDQQHRRGGQLMVDRAGGHALTGGWFEPGLSVGPGIEVVALDRLGGCGSMRRVGAVGKLSGRTSRSLAKTGTSGRKQPTIPCSKLLAVIRDRYAG
jgi:hypothetical protein